MDSYITPCTGNYCVELNKIGKRIQESPFLKCDDCPAVYSSNETYKFQSCYGKVNISNNNHYTNSINGTMDTTNTIPYEVSDAVTFSTIGDERKIYTVDAMTIAIFVLLAGVCVGVTLIAAFLIARKRQADVAFQRKENQKNTEEEEVLLEDLQQDTEHRAFVETNTSKKAEYILSTERIIFIIGPPSSGRSTIARQLIKSSENSKTVTYENHIFDLETREVGESTLTKIASPIYVNVFHDGYDCLKNFGTNITKLNCLCESVAKDKKMQLIVSASDSIAQNECFLEFLKDTKKVLNTATEELNGSEKREMIRIMLKQYPENAIKSLNFTEKNLKEIEDANPPIPFPLCAKLYFGNHKYQKVGIGTFFNDPILYFEDKIEETINRDLKLKTLLLFLYLGRCNNIDRDIYHKMEMLGELDFSYTVERNTNLMYLKEIKPFLKEGFEFKHDTAFHSVGSFYSKHYFTVAADVFHIKSFEWISDKNVEKENLLKLCDRFEREILKGNVREIIMSGAFKNKEFVLHFCENLSKRDAENLKKVFSSADVCKFLVPISLPFSFWVGTSRNVSLSELIYKLLCKLSRCFTDVDFHKDILLIGEHLGEIEFSKLQIIGNGDWELINFTKEYLKENMHSICEMVLRSDRTDDGVHTYLNDLSLDPKQALDKELLDSLLMSAVQCDCERYNTVKHLLFLGADVTVHDAKNKTVFDHCVETKHTDNTAFNYLQQFTQYVKKDSLREDFESALLLATGMKRYSRIKCMSFILSHIHAPYRSEIANSVFQMTLSDFEESRDPFSNLEKIVRISLLVFYGVSNNLTKSAKDSLIKSCDVKKLLDPPVNERKLTKMIENVLKKVRRCCSGNMTGNTLEMENILPEMNEKLRTSIKKSISYLCDKRIL